MSVNPLAVLLVGFCTALGALFGATLIGLVVGLGIVIVASAVPDPAPRYGSPRRRKPYKFKRKR